MAVTKILARKGRLDVGINYVLNGDKTQERVLTAHLNCDPIQGHESSAKLNSCVSLGAVFVLLTLTCLPGTYSVPLHLYTYSMA